MNKMKTATIVVLVFNLLTFKLQAKEGRITVHVVGEDGAPIARATVKGQFNNSMAAGSGAGGGIPTYVDGVTRTNGLCVLTGRCNEPSVGFAVFKDGYYENGGGAGFTNS